MAQFFSPIGNELPSISGMSYSSAVVDMTGDALGYLQGANAARSAIGIQNDILRQQLGAMNACQNKAVQPFIEGKLMQNQTRLVKVIIADPNQNIPLDKRILHMGEEKLTDLTDQELFFELNVKELLDKHNMERIGIEDKAASDRAGKSVHLEPARIRDLKMVVVTVATI